MKKQPDKITAYYYRAANKQTDLNLDNQMHRLLSHAQENRLDTYMFFVEKGLKLEELAEKTGISKSACSNP